MVGRAEGKTSSAMAQKGTRVMTADMHELTRVSEASSGISLVLPMFNESESVNHTMEQALGGLERHFADFEIIVVDDGSADDCASQVQRWAEKDPRIVLIRMRRNQRFGGALRQGLAAAGKDMVFYTDFDLPVPIDFFPQVLEKLAHTNIVTGYSAEQSKNPSWTSRLLSHGYNRLVRLFFRLDLRDVNFGFKAMCKSTCEQLQLVSRSPFVDAEMFIQARRNGHCITEVAVPFSRRQFGTSHIRRLDVIAWTMFDMARIWLRSTARSHWKVTANASRNEIT